jgi:hypothetical protein
MLPYVLYSIGLYQSVASNATQQLLWFADRYLKLLSPQDSKPDLLVAKSSHYIDRVTLARNTA